MRFLLGLLLLTSVALAERPNIIAVLTDDQGIGDVGVHGNKKIRTPAIDEFARDGIQMTRFYVEPVCAPTRAALMTGRYHYRTGVIHTSRGGAKMAADEKTLAEYLKEVGYRTGIFGKWHLGDNYPMRPQDQGFTESLVHKSGGIGQTPDKPNSYFNPVLWQNGRRVQAQGYCTDVFFDAAIEFIEGSTKESFFAYIPLNAPHTPLEIAPRYTENYLAMGLNETTSKVYGMIENIDDNFQRLIDRLDVLGIRDNTVVIFMTDNGAQQARFNAGFRGRKSHVYEGGIRVPFYLQWPSEFKRPAKINTLGGHIDLLPTLLDFTAYQGPAPHSLDGTSLRQAMHGRVKSWPDRSLIFQVHRGLQPNPFQNCAVVSQQYKLVGNPGTFGRESLPSNSNQLELYDLASDPAETKDLAAAKPDILRKLKADYQAWFKSVEASRQFTPERIHIGNPAEQPLVLSRYQDSKYVDGKPVGWDVVIEQSGRYRLSINRAETESSGRIHMRFNDRVQTRPVLPGGNSATFTLPSGKGSLEIWYQADGAKRTHVTNNGTVGNVTLTKLF